MQLASSLYRMQTLPAVAKAGIVVGGYVVAALLAFCVLSIYISQTSGPDRDASAGMFAFGDSLLFIAIFGIVSIIPTGMALVFLRQSRTFWLACSIAVLAVASTSLVVVAVTVLAPQSTSAWAMLAFPRIFLSPFLAAAFGLSALIAPEARFRWCLIGAASAEGLSSVYGFAHWFAPLFFH